MKRLMCAALLVSLLPFTPTNSAPSQKSVADYRYFRALVIDLLGRAPTRAEIATFERPDFQVHAWIDANLSSPSYAGRLRRVYMDLLKLELPWNVLFQPEPVLLRRQEMLGADNVPFELYYRQGQRRPLAAIDGDVCFTESESGLVVPRGGGGRGTPKPIPKALLESRTVLVKPWWLYSDYRSKNPQDRAGPHWEQSFPGFTLHLPLFVEPTGQPATAIRVCKEEAQASENGRIFVGKRAPIAAGAPFPAGRLSHQPPDLPFAKQNVGKMVSCLDQTGFATSHECGCGVGLERCLPHGPNGFHLPHEAPLGAEQPFVSLARPAQLWMREQWNQEAAHFMDWIFTEDRDVRELLTGKGTVINGPLAQFYRGMADETCCGRGIDFGYAKAEPLFERARVPSDLIPQETTRWVPVPDRGKHAAGIMTMPIFLKKYSTRRARAHVIYQAFLCRDFSAPAAKLAPSDEPDLAKRPGCAACHKTLEPLAAFFTRIQESDWTYLPAQHFPATTSQCTTRDPRYSCKTYFEPSFTGGDAALRGAQGSFANAAAGPAGLAAEIVAKPEFASCVVQNVTQSLLGRPLEPGDEAWKQALAKSFVDGGYRMRSLVKSILMSAQYRERSEVAK